jgi:hypothetical protein
MLAEGRNPNIANMKGFMRILTRPQKEIINNLALFDAPTNTKK